MVIEQDSSGKALKLHGTGDDFNFPVSCAFHHVNTWMGYEWGS
jgi:hypothetical protein